MVAAAAGRVRGGGYRGEPTDRRFVEHPSRFAGGDDHNSDIDHHHAGAEPDICDSFSAAGSPGRGTCGSAAGAAHGRDPRLDRHTDRHMPDPVTLHRVGHVPVVRPVLELASSSDGVWVLSGRDETFERPPHALEPYRLERINPATLRVEFSKNLPYDDSYQSDEQIRLVAAPGTAWIAFGSTVVRVNTRTGDMTSISLSGRYEANIAADNTGLWVETDGTNGRNVQDAPLVHIDASTNTVTTVPGSPSRLLLEYRDHPRRRLAPGRNRRDFNWSDPGTNRPDNSRDPKDPRSRHHARRRRQPTLGTDLQTGNRLIQFRRSRRPDRHCNRRPDSHDQNLDRLDQRRKLRQRIRHPALRGRGRTNLVGLQRPATHDPRLPTNPSSPRG